ncbi:protein DETOXIFICATION 16-like isoform X2 [Cucumis melo var. makuwa]|uniref:Protein DETOXIFICATION 16-like isoform X2 n=1 Tax=Cucumis melo var. makuwa TaxID=1194695 RepID=A0A5A7VNG5_CUCMM|nr:protein DETOXIFICATION 16-like isoform X2 [Cucumis melo var. makuwa]TYK10874.1 protein DETOXIFICATION 16-like isoform X2 [Cucumis melo var. makuwa]
MEEEQKKQSLDSPLILPPADDDGGCFTRDEIREEVKRQLRLAGPLMTVNVLINCLQMISVMFVGHLGQLPLASASMATSFAAVTGFSLLVRNHSFSSSSSM